MRSQQVLVLASLVFLCHIAFATTLGPAFQVNTYVNDLQGDPDIHAYGAGGFMVVWESLGQNGRPRDVYSQRYAAGGAPAGGEFRASFNFAYLSQMSPAVAGNADGRTAVAWTSEIPIVPEDDSDNVFLTIYDETGSAVITEVPCNSQTNNPMLEQRQPSVGMDSHGDVVVVWKHEMPGLTWEVMGQRFRGNGSKAGGEFQVSTTPTVRQSPGPRLAANGAGEFVVAWEGFDGDQWGVFGQLFRSSGTPNGAEFQANPDTVGSQELPDVAMNDEGGFMVVWQSEAANPNPGQSFDVYARLYDASGAAVTDPGRVNSYIFDAQHEPAVACDADGDFAVVWLSDGQNGLTRGVWGKCFDAQGNPCSAEFLIGDSPYEPADQPEVTSSSPDTFVAVWEWAGGTAGDVVARRFECPCESVVVAVGPIGPKRAPLLELHLVLPNPFSDVSTASFRLPAAGRVSLTVYNVVGARVATLVDETLPAGPATASWRGTDDSGRRLPSGVYFYRLEFGDQVVTRRVVLVK